MRSCRDHRRAACASGALRWVQAVRHRSRIWPVWTGGPSGGPSNPGLNESMERARTLRSGSFTTSQRPGLDGSFDPAKETNMKTDHDSPVADEFEILRLLATLAQATDDRGESRYRACFADKVTEPSLTGDVNRWRVA